MKISESKEMPFLSLLLLLCFCVRKMFNCKIDMKNVIRSYGIEQHVREHEYVNMSISALNSQCIQFVGCVFVCVFCVCVVFATMFAKPRFMRESCSRITLGILARLIFFLRRVFLLRRLFLLLLPLSDVGIQMMEFSQMII